MPRAEFLLTKHDVALGFQEAAHCEVADQRLVDRRGGEVELGQSVGTWHAGSSIAMGSASKKNAHAAEQERPDVAARRWA